ncbi:MAG: virulence RhuM family protein [Muribaculaceae bacterium]|nr:virulence RhuM family protein [Muribaculaceae bacterium]
METENEIIIYHPDSTVKLEVRMEDETVWLSQGQMAELFDKDQSVIARHISNVFKEGELDKESNMQILHNTLSKYKPTQIYSLDVIISVGYRVKSKRGTQFRQWANKVLKDYLLRGYTINHRLLLSDRRVDQKLLEHDKRLDDLTTKVDFLVRTSTPPIEGVFFDGQIFDAYALVCDLIQKARKRIVLIDNYADYTVLRQLDKRSDGVSAVVYTSDKNKNIKTDIKRHNSQYASIELRIFGKAHDRFLIIDDTIYHIGASLKDLGKKLFAFSRLEEMSADELLSRIDNNIP